MLRPQLPGQKIGDEFYGLGWGCAGKDEDFRFGHFGQDEGFLAVIRMFPARGSGAVVMINSIQGWRLRDELLAAISRAYGWPAIPAVARQVEPDAAAIAGDYAGRYASPGGTAVEIAHAGGGLTLTIGAQPALPLKPLSASAFFATALSLRVAFEDATGGKPAALSLVQDGKTIRLARVS